MSTEETNEQPDFGGEKVKMTKVEKFFQSQKEKLEKYLNGRLEQVDKKIREFTGSQKTSLDAFIVEANKNIKTMDNKFSQMYGVLVRQFLTNLENRIYTNELSNKALMLMLGEKLYKIEADKAAKENLPLPTKEEFLKALELEFVQTMTNAHNESEKAAAEEANKQEVKNEEVVQESVETPVPAEEVPAAVAQQ